MTQRNTDNPSDLLKDVRRFWFNNEPGTFSIGSKQVTRKEIQTYGGPAPQFNFCPTCQESEWFSRLEQRNLFQSHSCNTSERCQLLCSRQGDELWTLYHQNFWFAVGCDSDLQAPKGAFFFDKGPGCGMMYTRFWEDNCDHWMLDWRRMFAQACQIEIIEKPSETDWSRYDFLYTKALGISPINRPDIPVIAWGGDYLKAEQIQSNLNWLRPDILLTCYPTAWSQFEHIGKIWPGTMAASQFFTRPNLGHNKNFDLLVIGGLGHSIYDRRRELDEQLQNLSGDYRIKFDHHQTLHQRHAGPVEFIHGDKKVHYLNKWSEYLGSARFVTFGPIAPPCNEKIVAKYAECLGSGAIPILPNVTDLSKQYKVQPMVHYIPLSNVWKNNGQLRHYFDHYGEYKHIAEAAVQWHIDNVDRSLFSNFEDMVQELTENKYHRRLLV